MNCSVLLESNLTVIRKVFSFFFFLNVELRKVLPEYDDPYNLSPINLLPHLPSLYI